MLIFQPDVWKYMCETHEGEKFQFRLDNNDATEQTDNKPPTDDLQMP